MTDGAFCDQTGPVAAGIMTQKARLQLIVGALAAALAALVGAHLFAEFAWADEGPLMQLAGRQFRLSWLFDMTSERNVPAAYNAVLYLLIAVLLRDAARQRPPGSRLPWSLLSLLFVFLSVDEAASIHERVNNILFPPLWSALSEAGLSHPALRWIWVLPYSLGAVVAAALAWRWWIDLDRFTRRCFAVAFLLAISGALGMEMLGSWRVHTLEPTGAVDAWRVDLIYVALATAEETLEIAGLSLALFAIIKLANARARLDKLALLFAPGAALMSIGVFFFPRFVQGMNGWLGEDAYWSVVGAFLLIMTAVVVGWRGGQIGPGKAAVEAGQDLNEVA